LESIDTDGWVAIDGWVPLRAIKVVIAEQYGNVLILVSNTIITTLLVIYQNINGIY